MQSLVFWGVVALNRRWEWQQRVEYLYARQQAGSGLPQGIDCVLAEPPRFSEVVIRCATAQVYFWALLLQYATYHGLTLVG
jgi:hypothetical protein